MKRRKLEVAAAPDASQTQELSTDQISDLADMFRLMSDPSRLRIIMECLHTPTSVGDIASSLKLSTSLVSHHLRLLRAGRIIQFERKGARVFYKISDEHVRHVLQNMAAHVIQTTLSD